MPDPSLQLLLAGPGQALLDRLARAGVDDELAVLTTLRREGVDPRLAAAAVEQVRLRRRAGARFGEPGARMWWTPAGLEQATRPDVAAHRARRYAAAGLRHVVDLGCGVGGDLLALAAAVPSVLGVDRDPQAVLAARANAEVLGVGERVEVRRAEVGEVDLAGFDGAFVDPARRADGHRTFHPDAYSPPYGFVAELAARVPATSAKLAPGLPHALLPAGAEAEWVSLRGEVKELCLWHGGLRTPGVQRRATLLPSAATVTDQGMGRAPVGPIGEWLVEPDGAVIRAGLVAAVASRVDGRLLDASIAYITADTEPVTPYGRVFRVIEELPFARKRLRAALRAGGFSDVVVKKRGVNVVPDQLRHDLRLTGHGPTATIVLTRRASRPLALLVAPVAVP